MTDFYALSDGTELNSEDKSIELAGGGGDFLPIPFRHQSEGGN